MSLRGPINDEDLHKIHNEIGQIVRQRMTNTTFAITLLGIFGIFAIPKSIPATGAHLDPCLLVSSILLSCILFIVYMYNYCLAGMLRILTTYLIVTDTSGWEQDWTKYRKRCFYFGYTKAQTIIFVALLLVSTFWPRVVARIYSLETQPSSLLDVGLVLGVMFIVVVACIGFLGLGNVERYAKENWQRIKHEKNKE
jgi:phosphoglycerol transferase MdoB-like AlkP superfamily enzyme